MAAQAGLCLVWSVTPEDTFCRVVDHMYIAPGQRQTTPWGQILMSTEIPDHFAHLLPVKKKKISLMSDILPFLCVFFQMYIAPGRGRQPIRDKKIMTTERHFLFAYLLQVLK